ncbi:hypothetical protein DFH28DRAFT_1123056 [Melampsora americana]|nr:hypothetical protein DFH28DRAFT_1123056 [Melampsora americana]
MITTPEPSGSVPRTPFNDSPTVGINSSPLTSDQNKCPRQSQSHLYRGHRADSFFLKDGDEDLMIEWRARQRTFDGAYLRTSLACSIYALMIIRLYSKEFDKVGLIYALLSFVLLIFIYVRRKRLNHDLSDEYVKPTSDEEQRPRQKIWGREFRTAGDVIMILSLIVLGIQIALIAIILKM